MECHNDSIRARILDEMLRMLREDLTFAPVGDDDCGPLPPENIEFTRFKPSGKPGQMIDEDTGISTPAIRGIAPRIVIPAIAGTNKEEDWHYDFLWQLLNNTENDPSANYRTYWRWQEQIASYFSYNQLQQKINDSRGCVWATTATMVADVDEKVWPVSRLFVAGVISTVYCRQPRGIT